MENFLIVARQVAVLFVLMGFGSLFRRLKIVSDDGLQSLVNILIYFITPCLIVDVFQRPFAPEMLAGLGIGFLVAIGGHVAVIALAALFIRHRDENVRKPLQLAAVLSNAGFMGIPLEQAILGDGGVFYGVVYVVTFNLVIWSWGVKVMARAGAASESVERRFVRMAVNPGTIGLALGLPLFFFSLRLPSFVATPIHMMSNINTPLAMIVIGYCLFGAKLGKVTRMGAVYVSAALRRVACPLLMVAALYPFRGSLDRNLMLAMTIAASAPVAAMVSMFATKFERDVDVGVAMVSGTTLLSVATMPVVIALAMEIL